MEKEAVLPKSRKVGLDKKVVFAEINLFAVVVNKAGNPLLRRENTESEWEIIGGRFENIILLFRIGPEDLAGCQQSIFVYLWHRLFVEAGLDLIRLPKPLMFVPAWFWEKYGGDQAKATLSFCTPISLNEKYLRKTDKFGEKFKRKELAFIPRQDLCREIASREKIFLIKETLEAFYANRAFVL